ncbi:MAG TPA: hypothetical protein ENK13_02775 [Thermopetrobacter sp.]|nr:hypothetical protein [Thermopetrobacter sp.]
MYVHIKDRLMTGRPVLVAGSWGSELAARGVPLDARLWTAPANLSHAGEVRATARAYIEAGAHAVLTNTFSTGPLLMHALGRVAEMRRLDERAIGLLREAIDDGGAEVALAGSVSVYGAVPDDDGMGAELGTAEMQALFAEKVATFRDHGCDFIYLERVRGIRRGVIATEAAVATGLPVWVELAVERDADGTIRSAGGCRWRLEDLVSTLMSSGAAACLVSHADPLVIADALQILRMAWAGYQGVSLLNGHCVLPRAGEADVAPHWADATLTPRDYVIEADRWRRQRVQILAFTAGLGPDHLRAAAEALAPPART